MQQQAPNGDVTYRSYDYANRPRAVTVYPTTQGGPPSSLPLAASQTFVRDDANNLTDQLDFNQRDHAYTLDGASRVTQRVDSYLGQTPGAITTMMGYDPDGNARTLSRTVNGVAGTQAYTASYNATDWPLTQDDGQGKTTYGYDVAGRLRTQSLLGGSGVMTATRNLEGLATRIDESVTRAASLFGYTPDDRPYTDTLGAGTSVAISETRLHDPNDRLTQLSWSNAPLVGPPVAETYAYSYTPQGRTSIYVIESGGNGVSGGSVSSIAYSPDAHGRLLQETPGDAGVAGSLYRYDGNDNLSEVDQSTNLHTIQTPVITYVYSPTTGPAPWLPNELVSVTHNGDDPPGNQGTTAYAYDNAGNTTAITYPKHLTISSARFLGRITPNKTVPDF